MNIRNLVKRREGGHLSSERVYLFSCMLHLPTRVPGRPVGTPYNEKWTPLDAQTSGGKGNNSELFP